MSRYSLKKLTKRVIISLMSICISMKEKIQITKKTETDIDLKKTNLQKVMPNFALTVALTPIAGKVWQKNSKYKRQTTFNA